MFWFPEIANLQSIMTILYQGVIVLLWSNVTSLGTLNGFPGVCACACMCVLVIKLVGCIDHGNENKRC